MTVRIETVGRRGVSFLLALTCLTPAASLHADVTLGADLAVDLTATREDSDTETAGLLGITPSLRLEQRERNLSLDATAGATWRRSLNGDGSDLSPVLGLRGALASDDRGAVFDIALSSAFRDTSPIDATRAPPTTGTDDVATRRDDAPDFSRVDRLSLGPRFERTIAGRHRLAAGYRFAWTRVDDDANVSVALDEEPDTRQHALGLATESRFGRGGDWAVLSRLNSDTADAGDAGRVTTASALVAVRALYLNSFGVQLGVGRDWFDAEVTPDPDALSTDDAAASFESESTDDAGGTVISATVVWRPSARFGAALSWTERSYGESPAALVRIEGRRSYLSLRWQRELSAERTVRFGAGALENDALLVGLDGGGRDSTEAEASSSSPDLGAMDQDGPLFARDLRTVDERVSLDWSRRGRSSSIGLSLQHVRREDLDDGSVLSGTGLSLDYGRDIGRRTRLGIVLSRAIEDERSDDDTAAPSPALSRETRRTTLRLGIVTALR